jgi:subtilisin family serine protease
MGRASTFLVLLLAAAGTDARAPADAAVLRASAAGEPIDVLIRLRAPAVKSLPAAAPFESRVASVVDSLRARAARDQRGLRAALRARGIESRELWIANAVAARIGPANVAWIAARAEVVAIESDLPRPAGLPLPVARAAKGLPDVEPNVARVRAPEVWALGYRGQGVVIGAQDTGYQWDHPALRDAYRGWNGVSADHAYQWHDAIHALIGGGTNVCGINAPAPCDDNGHGTHTLGTMLGDGGEGFRVGVAPSARWIACRNMDRGVGRPGTYLECMQWFMAPTDAAGANPRPDLAAHVISNSWSCPLGPPPSGENCATGSFDTALANLRAAGILFVAAATNSGPGCSSVDDPPAISANALSVGATNNSDGVVGFSSRGPVLSDGSGRLKPDVMAPGFNVYSSIPGSAYGLNSGTSMATPNVAGVAALVMSAEPSLRGQPDQVAQILRETAQPITVAETCGGVPGTNVPNNTAGWGRVDAFAAVLRATGNVHRDGFE